MTFVMPHVLHFHYCASHRGLQAASRSAQAQSAVNRDELPGNEPGGGQKILYSLRDLIGRTGAARRSSADEALDALIRLFERNDAGGHGVDRDLRRPRSEE